MLSIQKRTLLLAIVFCLTLIACQTASYIQIETLEPAKITLPSEVKKIVVLNYSASPNRSETRKVYNLIRKIDSVTAPECVNGLRETLQESPRVEISTPYGNRVLRSTITEDSISWNFLTKICKEFNAQAIIVLQQYSSDWTQKTRYVEGETDYFIRPNLVDVACSWSIYYPDSQQVVYQQFLKYENVDNDFEQIQTVSYAMGTDFAKQISPLWNETYRIYYITENYVMQTAAGFAQKEEWEKASAIWKRYSHHPNKRIAAAACYNMALACEMNGKLDLAADWASKSVALKNNAARNYLNILQKRIENLQLVEEQMITTDSIP